MSDLPCFAAVLAIECEEAETPPRAVLERAAAESLGEALARDLVRFVGDVAAFDLVLAGALYDQAQILRPGWPVHAALGDAHERLAADGTRGSLVSIGAHEGRMPAPALEPDTRLHGSAMLMLPWQLHGDPAPLGALASKLERELLDTGMAGADLSLVLREQLGMSIRHVRHMSLHDLCALACAQYVHAGLDTLWQVVETVLLSPARTLDVALPQGTVLRYADGVVAMTGGERPERGQARAILAAHGIEVDAG